MLVQNLPPLPPVYKQHIQDFWSSYENVNDKEEKKKLLNEFSHNYFMIKELWDEWTVIYESDCISEEKVSEQNLMFQKAATHFYHNEKYQFFKNKKLLHFKRGFYHGRTLMLTQQELDRCVANFNYPYSNLDEGFAFYEEYSSSIIPKEMFEKYKKMKILFTQFKLAEKSDKEWFLLITQANDEAFVVHNVEYRLGKNVMNADLWKLYIKFMKNCNMLKALFLYSLYCRFFFEDISMREEYKNAVKNYGIFYVAWKNPFEFETYDPEKCQDLSYPANEEPLASRSQTFKSPDEYTVAKASLNSFTSQNFPLPKTIMNYISKNGEHLKILHKLHKCCKYFFVQYPYPVCHLFLYSHSPWERGTKFYNQSFGAYFKNETIIKYDRKFCISNSLHVFNSSNVLSKTLQDVIDCNPKHIRLSNQRLTFKEFQFIAGHVETLALEKVKIIGETNFEIGVEDILKVAKNVVHFTLNPAKTTSETFHRLSETHFKNKIKCFEIYYIECFDVINFCRFYEEKMAPDSSTRITFVLGYDPETRKIYTETIKKELKSRSETIIVS